MEGRSLRSTGKVHSADKLSFPLGRRRMRHSSLNQDPPVGGAGENVDEQSLEVTFKIAFSPKENDEYVYLYVHFLLMVVCMYTNYVGILGGYVMFVCLHIQ